MSSTRLSGRHTGVSTEMVRSTQRVRSLTTSVAQEQPAITVPLGITSLEVAPSQRTRRGPR
eukprot:6236039-Pyramimonas_sp.AAC.1